MASGLDGIAVAKLAVVSCFFNLSFFGAPAKLYQCLANPRFDRSVVQLVPSETLRANVLRAFHVLILSLCATVRSITALTFIWRMAHRALDTDEKFRLY